MRSLGLDISSSTIGVSVAERTNEGSIVPRFLDHIRLDNVKGLWAKHDEVVKRLNEMKAAGAFDGITKVAVEEALVSFRPGLSSAETITTLIRINILVCSTLRDMFGIDPDFIASSTARKLAGVKVQHMSKCGKSAKTQVFEHMQRHDLSHVKWPLRKLGKQKGEPVEQAKDVTDAWVIAKARLVQG